MFYKTSFCFLAVFGLFVLYGCHQPKENFGHFEGKVVATWLDDGRRMQLTQDFAYIDPGAKKWVAPTESIVDGASIPKPFWPVIGGPFEGLFRNASVVHDVACDKMNEPWQDVHLMFYNACRCGGVDEVKAKLMYAAVYKFGPRWEPATQPPSGDEPRTGATRTTLAPPDVAAVEKLKQFVETKNPSLEEIRQYNL